MTSAARQALFVSFGLLAACGGGPSLAPGAPFSPDGAVGTDFTVRLREDFESRELVQSSSTALVDVNRGVVRLPFIDLGAVPEAPALSLTGRAEWNGRIDAADLIIEEAGDVDAVDALELRSSRSLLVRGRIRAGPGGVVLTAVDAIRIEGQVESLGPIRVRLSGRKGLIEIDGRVATLPGASSAEIEIESRGRVIVRGQIESGGAATGSSGTIRIFAYQAVTLDGALLATGDAHAKAGDLRVSTEARLGLSGESRLLGGAAELGRGNGGTVQLRAVELDAENSAVLGGLGGAHGGRVDLRVERFFSARQLSVASGAGANAGPVELEFGSGAIAGSSFAAGASTRQSAPVRVRAAGPLTLNTARFFGSDSSCGRGGDLEFSIGGRLRLEDGVSFRAGAGGRECANLEMNGRVRVLAQDLVGDLEAAVSDAEASLALDLDPEYTRSAPDLHLYTLGWVRSRVIDRGPEGRFGTPRLVAIGLETPEGTFAKVQLAGEDEPDGSFGTWYDATTTEPEQLAPLAGKRYLAYRVWLKGRLFDTPVIDYFEFALGR